eukprot:g208.t1
MVVAGVISAAAASGRRRTLSHSSLADVTARIHAHGERPFDDEHDESSRQQTVGGARVASNSQNVPGIIYAAAANGHRRTLSHSSLVGMSDQLNSTVRHEHHSHNTGTRDRNAGAGGSYDTHGNGGSDSETSGNEEHNDDGGDGIEQGSSDDDGSDSSSLVVSLVNGISDNENMQSGGDGSGSEIGGSDGLHDDNADGTDHGFFHSNYDHDDDEDGALSSIASGTAVQPHSEAGQKLPEPLHQGAHSERVLQQAGDESSSAGDSTDADHNTDSNGEDEQTIAGNSAQPMRPQLDRPVAAALHTAAAAFLRRPKSLARARRKYTSLELSRLAGSEFTDSESEGEETLGSWRGSQRNKRQDNQRRTSMAEIATMGSQQRFGDSEESNSDNETVDISGVSDGNFDDMHMLTNVSEVSLTLALGGRDTPKSLKKGRRRTRLSFF